MVKLDWEEEDKQWNMAAAFLQNIDRRNEDSDQAAMEGNLLKWYRSLRSIYRKIHYKIIQDGNEEKEKKLEELFSKIKNYLKTNVQQRQLQKQTEAISLSQSELLLDETETTLHDLIHAYGIYHVFDVKGKKDPIKEIEDEFR